MVGLVGESTILKEGRHFDLNAEASLPAWFSGLLLAGAGGMAAIFAVFKLPNEREQRFWGVLALAFVLLSLDEVTIIHEAVHQTLSDWMGMSGPLHFLWLFFVPFVALFGIFYLRFVFRLPPSIRTRVIVAAVLFISGAIGVELIGGVLLAAGAGEMDPSYRVAVVIEESLEILGIVLFLTTLLRYAQDLGLRITTGP